MTHRATVLVERDAAFWDRIADHPEVRPWVLLEGSLAHLIQDDRAMPLATDHGGAIFWNVDGLGFVVEMHTLFTPEGWGREVAMFGRACIRQVMSTASLILTHEQEGYWRSRPPRSHGWKPFGDFEDAGFPRRLKLWGLSRQSWLESPIGRRV